MFIRTCIIIDFGRLTVCFSLKLILLIIHFSSDGFAQIDAGGLHDSPIHGKTIYVGVCDT